jgi:hypothetical protein
MFPSLPANFARRIRMMVFVLVAVLSIVPGLVRATKPLRELTPAPFRMSRGFERPPAKCNLIPPSEVAVPAVSLEEPQPQQARLQPADPNEVFPDSALDVSPEALRGPPRLPLV